ncbi:MAG: epoxyqueuosine reductase QueH [Candidatus Omnitrophota bacterium]
MRILLHICCAPCAIYTVKRLREKGHEVVGFFYNPNIHPASEYKLRKDSVLKLSEAMDFNTVSFRDFQFEDFCRKVNFHESDNRCHICWRLRLTKTAEYASKNGFSGFTTTLLISPYQEHDKIKAIGNDAADKYSAAFVYEDFRPGFVESKKVSKDMELYHQKYCGCIYSERERYVKTIKV